MNLCEAQQYFCIMIHIRRSITELLLQKMTSHKHRLWQNLFWRIYKYI